MPPSYKPSEVDLRERRNEIRGGLSRVNKAGVAVLVITLGLAMAAAVSTYRAMQQTELATRAGLEAREQLWNSYLTQAEAGRLSRVAGAKVRGLQAIAAAAAIRPSVPLRTEAIAHLALYDLENTGVSWTNTPNLGHAVIDDSMSQLLESDFTGTARIRSLHEPTNIFHLRSTNGPVRSAAFSRGNQILAMTHANHLLEVWNLAERRRAHTLTNVSQIRHSREKDLLLALMRDNSLRVLNFQSGNTQARLNTGKEILAATFDSPGDRVALATVDRIHLWDWQRDLQRTPLEVDGRVWSLAWHDGMVAAGSRSGELRVWNLHTGQARRLQAHQDGVTRLLFSPDGEILFSVSYDGSTKVWNPRSGELLLASTEGFAERFGPDGNRVLFRTQSGWGLWNLSRPEGVRMLDCSGSAEQNVWHADFSRDGRWLAATKGDGVTLFEVQTGRRILRQPMNASRTAYFLPNDTQLLVTSTHRIGLWPVISEPDSPAGVTAPIKLGKRELIPPNQFSHIESGTLSHDRTQLIIPLGDREAALFDLQTRRELLRITNAVAPKLSSISPDKRWIATGTFHGWGMAVWDAASGRQVLDVRDGNTSAYFTPDGRYLVSAGASHYRFHNPQTWDLVHQIPRESGSDLPNLAAFTSDGLLMAAVKELRRIELLEPGTWKTLASLLSWDSQVVTWPAFSADNRFLAVATSQDRVQLWDLAALKARLSGLGLDWDSTHPGGVPEPPLLPSPPLTRLLGTPTRPLLIAISLGVLVVILCGLFIHGRQRHLLRSYNEVDRLAERQQEQLGSAQLQLMHAQKMRALGTLAAGIAHDFNNLLSVIRMSNQLTRDAAPHNQDIQENVGEVEQAVSQGKKLVRSMLGYSREETGDQHPFSVAELVEDTVALLSKQFLNGIVLTLELNSDLPPAIGSRSRLEQILLNLIVNASEAMEGSGSLRLQLTLVPEVPGTPVLRPRDAQAYLLLRISDSGPGIPDEVLPRVFEPFFTTKHRGAAKGTGLGLSTVYSMAEQDGMGVSVESHAGRGTTFRLIIPLPPGMPAVPGSHTGQSGETG